MLSHRRSCSSCLALEPCTEAERSRALTRVSKENGYFARGLTNFDQTTFNSSFACGVQVVGTDGTKTYESPGNNVGSYFNNY